MSDWCCICVAGRQRGEQRKQDSLGKGLDITEDSKLGNAPTWLRKIKGRGPVGKCFSNVCPNCEKCLANSPSPTKLEAVCFRCFGRNKYLH
jgi:hypothetical protein